MSKNVRNLQAKKAATVLAMRALADAAKDRDFTAEEQKQFDEAKASLESLTARIDREQLLALEEAGISADGGVEIPAKAVLTVEDNAEKDKKRGFATFGHFAAAVISAGRNEGHQAVDKRLLIGAAAPTTTGAEGVGADGGFVIPPQYSEDIFRLSLGEDSLIPLTENVEIQSNSMVFPKTEQTPWGTNGVRARWQAEAGAGSQDKPVLGTQILRLHKLLSLVPLTDELAADSSALASMLPDLIGDSIRWKTNEAILFGTGAGQPQGVINSGAVITVAKDGGQATLTLSALNVANMISRLPPGSFGRALWVINPSVLPSLFTLTLGNYPIYLPGGTTFGGITASPYGALLGRPIMVSQHAAAFSALGDVQLHDMKYYRTITKAGGIQTATSMHLYFDADAMALRVTFRVDGSSKIAAPISPAKGAATLSPFVQLAAR